VDEMFPSNYAEAEEAQEDSIDRRLRNIL